MTFLNGLLAFGALAFTIPLVIHLLFRSRFRSLDWGAMFLLQDVIQANRRRLQWHQWILLLMRCAIPILLAFAMARPLLSSLRAVPDSQPMTTVLVLDDSRSMSAAGRDQTAIQATQNLLDSMSRRDEVILIRGSHAAIPAPAMSARQARESLTRMPWDANTFDWQLVTQSALTAVEQASNRHVRIVVVTDFGPSASFGSAADYLQQQLKRLASPPQVDWLQIGDQIDGASPLGKQGNVLVESVQTDAPAVLAGRPVVFSATLRNDSDLPKPGLQVQWLIEAQVIKTESVTLPPRESMTIRLRHTFEQPLETALRVNVQHDDLLLADNRRTLAVSPLAQIDVWLVDGSPSSQPLQGETDFLRIALSPFAFQSVQASSGKPNLAAKDLVNTRVISDQKLRQAWRKAEQDETLPDLIVLANVAEPPSDVPLDEYLQSGGKVMFFDGEKVNPTAWKDTSWLPARLGDVNEEVQQIQPPGRQFSPWAVLGDRDDSLLEEVELSSRRQWELDTETTTLLKTASGQPLAALAGGVVQFAIPCDAAWSNLPLREVYLPMMQQLVLHLAGQAESRNIVAGSPLAMTLQPGRWKITAPQGETSWINVTEEAEKTSSLVAEIATPGIYRLVHDIAADSSERQIVVAEIAPQESRLDAITGNQISAAADKVGARFFTDASSLLSATQQDRLGLEIWRPLVWLLLLIMIGELLWQQTVGTQRRRETHSTPLRGGAAA